MPNRKPSTSPEARHDASGPSQSSSGHDSDGEMQPPDGSEHEVGHSDSWSEEDLGESGMRSDGANENESQECASSYGIAQGSAGSSGSDRELDSNDLQDEGATESNQTPALKPQSKYKAAPRARPPSPVHSKPNTPAAKQRPDLPLHRSQLAKLLQLFRDYDLGEANIANIQKQASLFRSLG